MQRDNIDHAKPRPSSKPHAAMPALTPMHGMLLTLQADIRRLEAEVEAAMAQAQLAMINPRPAAVAEDSDDIPWVGRKIADNGASSTIRVNQGRWTRNSDIGKEALTLNCGTNTYLDISVGRSEYLVAVLLRSVSGEDERIHPDNVVLQNIAEALLTTLAPSTSGNGGYWVIGKTTASGDYVQLWYGGDIVDYLYVGDADIDPEPCNYSIERVKGTRRYGQSNSYQLRNFTAGTSTGTLSSGDLIAARKENSPSTGEYEIKYATPKQVTDASGAAGGTMPPSAHTHDGDDIDLAHSELTDVVAQTVGDDHRGGRTAATAISSGHPYIHANGDATRNAMTGVLGSGNAKQSIDPSNRSLFDGDEQASLNWQVRELRKGNSDDTWEAYDCHFLVRDATKSFKHGSDTGFTDSRTFTQIFDDGTSIKLRYAGGIVVPA